MKKFLTIFCTTAILATQAHATGFFIGADALRTDARHEAENSSLVTGPQDGDKTKSTDSGYGVNLGFRFDPLMLYVSGETFYERLNSSASGFAQNTSTTAPNIKMDDRYGAKANVGITILPWLTPFITYGVARVSYETDENKHENAPLYGVGLMFDIPLINLSIKAAYDIQRIHIPYQSGQSDTKLGVAHLGLVYNFEL